LCSRFYLQESKWRNPCCRFYSDLCFAIHSATAFEVTHTIAIPDFFIPIVSVLGVAPNGITTYLYIAPQFPDGTTTFLSKDLLLLGAVNLT
jgi:hypothetical protein